MAAQVPRRGSVVHISVAPGTANPSHTVAMPVPVEKLRGKRVFIGADVKTANGRAGAWNTMAHSISRSELKRRATSRRR